jgi:hypothetical protein
MQGQGVVNPRNHPDCPRCKGEGFYLRREGHGFYRDGSFGHNDWQDCNCYPEMKPEQLPKAVDPTCKDRWWA